MLSVSPIENLDYYLDLSRQESYYVRGEEPPGLWHGEGAIALGLTGQIQEKDLRAVMHGIRPDGKDAVQNAKKANRQPGWDLTFSADKSVSVLWSQADEATRRQIEACHAEAAKAALDYLQDVAGWTRRGHGGTRWERTKLLFGLFEHSASREGDPQLHTHTLIANLGVRDDGRLGAIVSRGFYKEKMTAGALYRAELAARLTEKLGLGIERENGFFHLAGLPQAVCQKFSRRRVAIEAARDRLGAFTEAAMEKITGWTRKSKVRKARETWMAEWREMGEKAGFTWKQGQKLLGKVPPPRLAPEKFTGFQEAVERLLAEDAHFHRSLLLRYAAETAPGTGMDVSALRREMERFLQQDPEIVCTAEDRFTTRKMLAMEQRLHQAAGRMQESLPSAVSKEAMERAIAASEHAATQRAGESIVMNEEQRKAMEQVTCRSGSLQLVSGMAGTGKTFFLDAARRAWEAEGFEVIGAAVAGKAARGLQEGAGIKSVTLARLLKDLQTDFRELIVHHLQMLGRAALGKPTWGPRERLKLTARTVLVVDEAAMVATPMLSLLMTLVEKAGAKLVLVGDDAQVQAIGPGGAFRWLLQRFGSAKLTHIVRQRQAWARKAVLDFAEGRTEAGLAAFVERGLVSLGSDRWQTITKLIDAWKQYGVTRPEDCLIFAGTREEVRLLNQMAQRTRREAGMLKRGAFHGEGQEFRIGDRVMFTENSRRYGVENGTMATLTGYDRGKRRAHFRLEGPKKRTVSIDVRTYRAFTLGYAVTTHKGQGVTTERAYVLAGGSMQDRELTYVQMSRARAETRLYVNEAEAGGGLGNLIRQMKQSRRKTLAVEQPPAEQRQQPVRAEYEWTSALSPQTEEKLELRQNRGPGLREGPQSVPSHRQEHASVPEQKRTPERKPAAEPAQAPSPEPSPAAGSDLRPF